MNAKRSAPVVLSEAQLDALVDAGNGALSDYYHERACACSEYPAGCATDPAYRREAGHWDTGAFAVGMAAVLAVWESMRAPDAELEAQAGDGHTRTGDENPLPIALTQPTDVTAGQWATAIDAVGLRPGPAYAARYVTGEYDAAVHIATSPMLTDDARQELIEELITAVDATINRVLCTRTVRVTPPASLSQVAAEVLEERSTPWVGEALPAPQAICRCGHTGSDHHHAGRSCGASLPRRRVLGEPWGPLEPCDCREFAAVPEPGVSA